MGVYVLLTTLTPHGGETLHAHPERMVAVNEEIGEFNTGAIAGWWVQDE